MAKVSSFYYKPLVSGLPVGSVDIDRVFRLLEKDVLKRMKAKMMQTTFSERARKRLSQSLRVEIKKSSLVITALHPAFFPLIKGQRSQQMTWLTKAKRPIPIVTESGELIFRTATAKSMANGRWVHPGRKPQDFIEKAKAESRAYVKKRIRQELKKQIASQWGKK